MQPRKLTDEEKQDIKDRSFLLGEGIREISRKTGFPRCTVRRILDPNYAETVKKKQKTYTHDRYANDDKYREKKLKQNRDWARNNPEKRNAGRQRWRDKRRALGLPAM